MFSLTLLVIEREVVQNGHLPVYGDVSMLNYVMRVLFLLLFNDGGLSLTGRAGLLTSNGGSFISDRCATFRRIYVPHTSSSSP